MELIDGSMTATEAGGNCSALRGGALLATYKTEAEATAVGRFLGRC